MLTVGVLGCGQASTAYHLPTLRALSEFEIAWVCDLDEELSASTGDEYDVKSYTDPQEGIADTPDIINVNTPPFTHKELTIKSLTAGAHVNVEKPFAMNVEEGQEMIEAAEEETRKINVIHNNLFFDPMIPVLRSINKGGFGEIVSLHSFLGGSPSEEERDWVEGTHGGPLGDRIPHPIYLVTHFMDDVSSRSIHTWGGDEGQLDGLSIQINDESASGSIQVMESALPAKGVEIVGTKKRALVDLFNYTKIEYDTLDRSPLTMFMDNMKASSQILSNTGKNGVNFVKDLVGPGQKYAAPGHYHLLKAFGKSVSSDSEVPVPPEQGLKVVEIMEDIEDGTD